MMQNCPIMATHLRMLDPVPRDGSLNLRISSPARKDLTELVQVLNTSQTTAVEMALRHLLSTVLRDQSIYVTLPPGSGHDPRVA